MEVPREVPRAEAVSRPTVAAGASQLARVSNDGYDLLVLPRLRDNVQRLVDEYVGAVGSAVIVSRTGDVLFRSAHDDAARALAPILRCVSRAQMVGLDPEVVSVPVDRLSCGYATAVGDEYVLLVVTDLGVAPAAAMVRVKNAARLLRRVLRAEGAPSDGGPSGAPATIAAASKPRPV